MLDTEVSLVYLSAGGEWEVAGLKPGGDLSLG